MNPRAPRGAERLIADLRATIDAVLDPLVPRGTPCALLAFPNHPNVGDSAIWLGQLAWLRRREAPIVYTCEVGTYSPARLQARLGDGVILLCGGGSLGDLWIEFHRFVERVVGDFPGTRIVQLPQSVRFADEGAVARARAVFDAHPRLTLLLRDRQSLDFARRAFATESRLCPDMALELGPLARPARPTHDIAWLSRTDVESRASSRGEAGHGVVQDDWITERPSPLRLANWGLSRLPPLKRALAPVLTPTYEHLARQRLLRGCRFLARGRAVISDRLHGHILSLLLGIPHVVLDNSYGKNRAFHETWTAASPLVAWADSAPDALTRARALA